MRKLNRKPIRQRVCTVFGDEGKFIHIFHQENETPIKSRYIALMGTPEEDVYFTTLISAVEYAAAIFNIK